MYFISLKNVERKLENNEKIRNLMGGVTKLCFTAGIEKDENLGLQIPSISKGYKSSPQEEIIPIIFMRIRYIMATRSQLNQRPLLSLFHLSLGRQLNF